MLSIHTLIPPGCILIHPEARNKEDLIKLLVDAVYAAGKIETPKRLYEAVLAREELAPTGIGCGCAIPHAHSSTMEETVIAVALLEDEIDFQAPDGQPAFLVFLVAGPPRHAGLHLKILSRMVRLLSDPGLIENLKKASDTEAFLSLIQNREE